MDVGVDDGDDVRVAVAVSDELPDDDPRVVLPVRVWEIELDWVLVTVLLTVVVVEGEDFDTEVLVVPVVDSLIVADSECETDPVFQPLVEAVGEGDGVRDVFDEVPTEVVAVNEVVFVTPVSLLVVVAVTLSVIELVHVGEPAVREKLPLAVPVPGNVPVSDADLVAVVLRVAKIVAVAVIRSEVSLADVDPVAVDVRVCLLAVLECVSDCRESEALSETVHVSVAVLVLVADFESVLVAESVFDSVRRLLVDVAEREAELAVPDREYVKVCLDRETVLVAEAVNDSVTDVADPVSVPLAVA